MKPKSEQPAAASTPCRHLRTKRMYIPVLAEDALDLEQGSHDQSFYWCNRTLGALGTDSLPAAPCDCQPGRSCHEA